MTEGTVRISVSRLSDPFSARHLRPPERSDGGQRKLLLALHDRHIEVLHEISPAPQRRLAAFHEAWVDVEHFAGGVGNARLGGLGGVPEGYGPSGLGPL